MKKLTTTQTHLLEKAKENNGRVEFGGKREVKAAHQLQEMGFGFVKKCETLIERSSANFVHYYTHGVFETK